MTFKHFCTLRTVCVSLAVLPSAVLVDCILSYSLLGLRLLDGRLYVSCIYWINVDLLNELFGFTEFTWIFPTGCLLECMRMVSCFTLSRALEAAWVPVSCVFFLGKFYTWKRVNNPVSFDEFFKTRYKQIFQKQKAKNLKNIGTQHCYI